jgi:YbbR domain-containing protein
MPSRVSESIFHRWPLKMFSIILAYAIWLTVTGESSTVNHFAVPLEISISDSYTILGSVPAQVSVRLRGRTTAIRRIDPLKLKVSIDLSDANTGVRSIQFIATDLVGGPPGAIVERFEPARLSLILDERLRRVLPVIPAMEGELAEGFELYQVRATPETVEVEGPASLVSGLTGMVTDTISLEGRSTPFRVQTSTVPENPSIRILGDQQISAQFTIDKAGIQKRFVNIPVVAEGQRWEVEYSPGTIQATVSAPPNVLDKIDPDQIRAVVNLSGLAPGDERRHLDIRLDFPGMTAGEKARILVKNRSHDTISVQITNKRANE